METKPKSSRYWFLVILGIEIILLTLAFTGGFFLRERLLREESTFPIFDQAYEILKAHALADLPDTRKLEYGMIRGLVEAVGDPHTMFIEPPQHELQSNQLEGKFGGIGAHIEMDGDGMPRLYPFEESPARNAGILDGDLLVAVDDWRIEPLTPLETIQAAIRGPIGEPVNLLVFRNDENRELSFEIQRAEVSIPSVTWNILEDEPRVGVLHLNVIAATTKDEIVRAIEDLQSKGATHFILDLRNNSGGLVDGGVEIARLFLDDGDVISQQYRGRPVETFTVNRRGQFSDLPLVVLVNHGTASAAEIVAGTLQAQKRAVLIGAPTYGKNTIQLVFNLDDGSSLHVTAARWWIPGLEFPAGDRGLSPDVAVSMDDSVDDAFYRLAVEQLLGPPPGSAQR